MTREDAKVFMRKVWRETTKGSYAEEAYEMAIKALEQPEVIRCKDCKYHSHDAGYGHDWCNRTSGVFRVKPDDFCSFAERKDTE